jgi:K+-sensing histidine kinase KdpD
MKKPVIICVDDEKIVLDSIKTELRNNFQESARIEIAESGVEALELIKDYKNNGSEIPILIADYTMPGMKGDELMREFSKIYPDSFTILLTGQATMDGVKNAINWSNLFRYIQKPWDNDDLILTVKEALNSYFKDLEIKNQRKELEFAHSRVQKLDNAKTYFISLMSHELNTPLNAIQGNAQIIKSFSADSETIDCAEQIMIAANRLKKFNDLSLMITRIRTDQYDINMRIHSLKDIISYSIINQSRIASSKNINIELKLQSEDIKLYCDEQLMDKAIDIILNNAVKYSPQNSTISIEEHREKDKFHLVVRDRGPGFSEDSLEHVFEYFVSDEIMHHTEGMGLGLAAAKLICEAHSAELKAFNDKEGGAIVQISFNISNMAS